MKKLLALAAGLALSLAVTAVSGADKLKVGFIYVGPIGDHGWTYQHDQGRLAVEAALGDKIETVYVENVAEGPDAERAITRLARDGAGLIFTTSFGYMDPTNKVAKNFPDVKFEHATGYKRGDNVTTYSARFYEGRYVIGQIAAQMSKSGVAGYVASFPIPEVVRGINAFLLGAQSINPDFKIKVVWVNSWFDPGKEADAAKVMIGQGADIISQHTDSTAPLQIAAEMGVVGFGQTGFGHDRVRAESAAHLDHRQLGALLRRPHPGRARRHLGVHGYLGRDGDRHGRNGPLYQPARRRGRDGNGDRRQDCFRRDARLRRPHPSAGRRHGDRRRRAPRRRHPPRHELVRDGRRRRSCRSRAASPVCPAPARKGRGGGAPHGQRPSPSGTGRTASTASGRTGSPLRWSGPAAMDAVAVEAFPGFFGVSGGLVKSC